MLPRELRENLMSPDFQKQAKKHYYEKCQHAEDKNKICLICGARRNGETIAQQFINDLSRHEKEDSEETILETTEDGISLEVTWDELGSEIFSRTYQPSLELKMIMEGLKELH